MSDMIHRHTKELSALLFCALVFALSGCRSITSMKDVEPFRRLVGTTQTMKREALLYTDGEESTHQAGVFYDLHDKEEGNNSWRKEGWVVPGTQIQILEINRYLTDGRGPWIGVVAIVEEPVTRKKVKCLYCWSHGQSLSRAPWEDDSVPNGERKVSVLP